MKIGIMGGTFNPIHLGHILLASAAKKDADLDEVWFMPSGLPAHKSNSELVPAEHRLAMVKLSIKDIPGFVASSYEIDRPGFTYTADTLEALAKEYPQHEFYFIIGGDSLMQFHHWVKPKLISSYATLLAAGRNDFSEKELNEQAQKLNQMFGTDVRMINMPKFEISSNLIRKYWKENQMEDVRKYISEDVLDYILKYNLYQ